MVFEDGWLEVRVRQYWEMVHCSLLLNQPLARLS
jgi:hypothetical protein